MSSRSFFLVKRGKDGMFICEKTNDPALATFSTPATATDTGSSTSTPTQPDPVDGLTPTPIQPQTQPQPVVSVVPIPAQTQTEPVVSVVSIPAQTQTQPEPVVSVVPTPAQPEPVVSVVPTPVQTQTQPQPEPVVVVVENPMITNTTITTSTTTTTTTTEIPTQMDSVRDPLFFPNPTFIPNSYEIQTALMQSVVEPLVKPTPTPTQTQTQTEPVDRLTPISTPTSTPTQTEPVDVDDGPLIFPNPKSIPDIAMSQMRIVFESSVVPNQTPTPISTSTSTPIQMEPVVVVQPPIVPTSSTANPSSDVVQIVHSSVDPIIVSPPVQQMETDVSNETPSPSPIQNLEVLSNINAVGISSTNVSSFSKTLQRIQETFTAAREAVLQIEKETSSSPTEEDSKTSHQEDQQRLDATLIKLPKQLPVVSWCLPKDCDRHPVEDIEKTCCRYAICDLQELTDELSAQLDGGRASQVDKLLAQLNVFEQAIVFRFAVENGYVDLFSTLFPNYDQIIAYQQLLSSSFANVCHKTQNDDSSYFAHPLLVLTRLPHFLVKTWQWFKHSMFSQDISPLLAYRIIRYMLTHISTFKLDTVNYELIVWWIKHCIPSVSWSTHTHFHSFICEKALDWFHLDSSNLIPLELLQHVAQPSFWVHTLKFDDRTSSLRAFARIARLSDTEQVAKYLATCRDVSKLLNQTSFLSQMTIAINSQVNPSMYIPLLIQHLVKYDASGPLFELLKNPAGAALLYRNRNDGIPKLKFPGFVELINMIRNVKDREDCQSFW